MNTDSYTLFKQAFLDQVTMKGYDADFIDGFFKRAEEEYSRWEALVQDTYHGDQALCKQAYSELAYSLRSYGVTEKMAEGGAMGSELLGLLEQLGSGAAGLFGQKGGSGLGGAIAGGGGGLLIGLLLSQLLGIPLSTGMLLGALGGAGLGYGAGGTAQGQKSVFGVSVPPAPELPGAAKATVDPAGEAGPQNNTAATDTAANQAVSNQAAAGSPPPQAGAVPGPGGAAPVTPPPAQTAKPGASAGPGAAPVTPPGGAPGPLQPGTQSPGIPPIGASAAPGLKPPGTK